MELLGAGGVLSVAVTLMESHFLGGSQSCDSAQVKEHSARSAQEWGGVGKCPSAEELQLGAVGTLWVVWACVTFTRSLLSQVFCQDFLFFSLKLHLQAG